MKKILLASFVDRSEIDEAITKITSIARVNPESIFIFELDKNQYILTYNIDSEIANLKFDSFWKDTISIHRKKETNTLFSLNAMNEVIRQENGGKNNPNTILDWRKYENKFLIYRRRKLTIIDIKLVNKSSIK